METDLKYYILLDEKGIKKSCGYREDEDIPEDVKMNGFLVTKDEFNKLLNGFLRNPVTGENEEIPPYEPTLDELKAHKKAESKATRDALEVKPIEYKGNTYDFDTDSRDRLDIALKALSVQGDDATIGWAMADNTTATITAADIMGVFVTSAVRSNALHEQYRSTKEKIEAAQSVEELNEIELGGRE